MNIFGNMKRYSMIFTIALMGMMFGSCDSVIYEDEGDCTPYYHIKFKYDMNMKYADAFRSEVKSVALYVFDESGTLVQAKTQSGDVLAQEGYYMPIEVSPGEYDLLAWCGVGAEESFDLPDVQVGVTKITEMKAYMKREHDAEGKAHNFRASDGIGKDLNALFHGMKHVTLTDEYGVHEEVISLTKDTNVVRVVLQHLSGNDVDPALFRFEITDTNGWLDYDNSTIDDEYIHYAPWSITTGNADINADIYETGTVTPQAMARNADNVSVAVAELTVSRLMTSHRPVLAIYNVEKGTKVLSIPLIDYALLVKGNYNRPMDDQEYLDREDEYNLTFFLDEYGNWASAVIYINSWRVVLQDHELQ